MNTKTLSQLGLTDSEIKAYFALLELESSTVGPIIEKSQITDSKAYAVLDRLKRKGLVTYVIKNNVRHYQACDPSNLIVLLQNREAEISQIKDELTARIIPRILMRRRLTKEKQEATVYESYKGVAAAFNLILELLGKGDEYRVFMLGEALEDEDVVGFFENYHRRRMEKGIKARLISHPTYRETIMRRHKYKGMSIRFCNQKLPVGTFIFKDIVMTVIWADNPTAFVIKSRSNFEHYRDFFDDLWEKSTG